VYKLQFFTFIVYIDDLLLTSSDENTHFEHLRVVFTKLREANLKLHPQRCQIMVPEITYLSYIVNSNRKNRQLLCEIIHSQKQLRKFEVSLGFAIILGRVFHIMQTKFIV